jgi:hypothetical protein
LSFNTYAQDAVYKAVAMERAAKIVEKLKLSKESSKEKNMKNLIAQQYVSLYRIHANRDEKIKLNEENTEKIKANTDKKVKTLHQSYIKKLSNLLSNEQVEEVKNGMTYHTLPITYTNYLLMLPYATEQQKEMILKNLKEARELAMDAGSSKEKHALFNKYKGRIANQLAADGYDLKKEGEDWAQRRDIKSTVLAITQSSKVVEVLHLQDHAKKESVRNLVAYQYQKLEELNKQCKNYQKITDSLSENKDEKLAKAWEKHKAILDKQRDVYLAKLKFWLDDKQIELVKDEMTAYGLDKEYKRFQELLPQLTTEHKTKIYQYLIEARENALNVLSSKERNQWFIKYRGRANNYLSAQGYDLRKATDELQKRRDIVK